jgi:hypothetical protein
MAAIRNVLIVGGLVVAVAVTVVWDSFLSYDSLGSRNSCSN